MKLHPGGKVVVVGGGYIATEVVAKLLENNLQVSYIELERIFATESISLFLYFFFSFLRPYILL